MQKKYQVFVSSTFRDLVDERQDAIRNILDLKHIPAGMELFPAADIDQLSYIKKVIDECDYYILIMGNRYGSIDEDGVSFTEREYDYAVETGKTVLAFVHDDPSVIPIGKSDISPKLVSALESFRQKVMTGRLVRGWSSRSNLEPAVLKALIHAFNDFPQTGWIRGDAAASQDVLSQSNAILQQNATLKSELDALKKAAKPTLDNLADLDDNLVVRFTEKWRDSRSTLRYSEGSHELTWRSIFVALAGRLKVSQTDQALSGAVETALKDVGQNISVSSLDERDAVRIKIQFEALNLINIKVMKTTAGRLAEFLSLTEKGRAVLIDAVVVRSANTFSDGIAQI